MGENTIETISPTTGQVVCSINGTTLDEARGAAQRSKAAFEIWRRIALAERKSIVANAVADLVHRRDSLGQELTEQMGRPISYAAKEIDTMQKRATYLLGIAETSLQDLPGEPESGFDRFVKREPVGPTLIIFAWNFPYLILVNALVPALLAGNSVIIKPSPQTPLVAVRILEAFEKAGLPPNVLQVLQSGQSAMLKNLVQLPEIQLVSFTGSTKVGLELRQAIANRTIPLILELGGNDPAYVRADANLKFAAESIVDGAIFNSGQSCCSVERIYAHTSIHDELVREIQQVLQGYRLGSPFEATTSIGPVISTAAVKAINSHVQDALAKGAIDMTPANPSFSVEPGKGNYVPPKLLTKVNHNMLTMTEETFGPIIPIAAVSSDEEAISLMNDSQYGLTASVWTKDIEAGRRIIAQLEAGTVFINRCDYPSPDLAWNGWKMSGSGFSLGPRAFDSYVKFKSYHVRLEQT